MDLVTLIGENGIDICIVVWENLLDVKPCRRSVRSKCHASVTFSDIWVL